MAKLYILLFIRILILFESPPWAMVKSEDEVSECRSDVLGPCHDKARAHRLNYTAIGAILVASMVGVSLPLFSRAVPAFEPDKDLFFLIRAFASGVIVAIGFMHVMPDSWNDLTSPCLSDKPWRAFPFIPFITMLSAYGTMMMDSFSIAYYGKRHIAHQSMHQNGNGNGNGNGNESENGNGNGNGNRNGNSNGNGNGNVELGLEENDGHCHDHNSRNVEVIGDKEHSQLLKDRVVAQVLELGIVVHSVVIGLSLGASDNPCTTKPLIAAICFHQLFEGMGLGGCILQAEYRLKVKGIMVFFFSATTPLGIVLGILLQNVYKENSPTALIVVSSGLLIYMAMVDLLAADFKGQKLQKNLKLQGCCYVVALLGTGLMSLMAKWA